MLIQRIQKLQQDTEGFQQLAKLLQTWTGIRLPSGRQGMILLTSRISTLLARTGLSSLGDYAVMLRPLPSGNPDREAFISALSTHTTSFFREAVHFDVLQEAYLRASDTFKVWSAACSTGSEPYTMAMVLEEARARARADYRILATDIAEDVLLEGLDGRISEAMAQQIPIRYRSRFWSRQPGAESRFAFSAAPAIRKNIRWSKTNLTRPQEFPRAESFDVIFCRNVLIYFDSVTANQILDSLMNCLKPGGLLVLGHSESGVVVSPHVQRLGLAVFKKAQRPNREKTRDSWAPLVSSL